MKRFPARFLILLLPLAAILPFSGRFPFPAHAEYSDLAVSHYPNAIFLIDSLLRFHQVPLWSPLILSGYPFAANPLSGLWYPPGWLALLFPLPFGFNLLVGLHWVFGGAGMYRWLRAEGLASLPALLGALCFPLLPRVFAHYAAGHLSLSYALAWTPWLLLAARKPSRAFFFLEGILLGLIGLADLRGLAFVGLLWAAYRVRMFLAQRGPLVPWLLSAAAQPVFASLLAAPLLLPLLEYTRLSTRAALQTGENLVQALPAVRLFSLFSPSFDGNTEWTVYAGGVALVLCLWAVGNRELRQRVGFWLGVLAAALLLSLGPLPWLYRLPGFDLLRVPSRFVLLAGFALVVIAAQTVQYLSEPGRPGEKAAFWSRLLVAGAAAFNGLTAFGAWALSGQLPLNFLWSFTAIALAAGLLFVRDRARLSAGRLAWLLVLLTAVDLMGTNRLSVDYHSAGEVLSQGSELAEYVASQPGPGRIFSSSYSLPQQTAARYQIDMANGVDPLQLFSYAKFIEKASGVPPRGYSVVLPPVTGDDLAMGNAAFQPDAARLGLLNVRWVAAEYPVNSPGLRLISRFGSTYLYENQSVLPRAWVQSGSVLGQGDLPVHDLSLTPNQIDLTATGPGLLVISEVAYPGWQVTIDGRLSVIEPYLSLVRSVQLPAGSHHVRFTFRPLTVYAGLAVLILAVLLVLAGWIRYSRRMP